ncbi:MAG: hypothetical protein COB45_03480 [Gammaproteobacteria bacterium]|jgi:hypothetical protein|nr:MAG: hypothetical protein COB45_03480 [Gammaproteobacteria bacterium]PHR84175.1 MAG: hypothetical protein COA59_07870 [Colwellia sp.]
MTTKYPLCFIQLFILFATSLLVTQAYSSEPIRILTNGQQQTYSEIESSSYSEAMPIKQLLNDLKGAEIKDGEFAYTHNQFEIGHRWGAFELAIFWRYDYFLTFSPDTAWLFYLDKNNKSANNQKNYNVRLNANHLDSQGAAIGYSFYLLPELAIKTRLNYFNSGSMTYGSLTGNITTSADDYTGTLALDYSYKHDSIFNRPEESISGQGLGIDIDVFWQLTNNVSLYMQGRDVFSYIKWDEVTYTKATAITDRVSYDANGSIHVIPNISGINGYRNQIQKLPNRYLFDLNYHLESWQLALQWYRYDNFNFPRVKFGSREQIINWHLGYDLKTSAVEVGFEHSNISFKVKSDDLNLSKAHDFSFSLSVNYIIE